MSKAKIGNFFEDYHIGMEFNHPIPRSLGLGEKAIYQSLYPNRFSIYSSDTFASECGFLRSPLDKTYYYCSKPSFYLNSHRHIIFIQIFTKKYFEIGDLIFIWFPFCFKSMTTYRENSQSTYQHISFI